MEAQIMADIINIATQLRAVLDQTGQKCFICFGTLLYFCRDKVFRVDDDIDIGVIGDPDYVAAVFSNIFVPIAKVIDDATGEPYQMTFKSSMCKGSIDVYFWHKKDGFYYHTYNVSMEKSVSGKLSKYTFKGTPASCFDAPPGVIDRYQDDIRYGRAMTNNGTWDHLLPQCPEEGISMPLPFGYGHCLDTWYPDWGVKRPQFGQSEAANTFTVKTCRGLKWQR
jgi:hypothetical protein